MVAGRRLFAGETVSHTLADVLRKPIDLAHLPDGTPRSIRRLIDRCLDRDRMRRLRDIGEARIVIEGTAGGRNPFYSPDGEWIGFMTTSELYKVRPTGGGCSSPSRAEGSG